MELLCLITVMVFLGKIQQVRYVVALLILLVQETVYGIGMLFLRNVLDLIVPKHIQPWEITIIIKIQALLIPI